MDPIVKIRLSGQNKQLMSADERKYWHEQKVKIFNLLKKEGFTPTNMDGTIQPNLIGPNGVHTHTPHQDGYIWLGQPNPAEALYFLTKFVGTQTLDKNMYLEPGVSFNFNDYRVVKPNALYMPDDAPNQDKNVYNLLYRNLQTLFDAGTINEFVENKDGTKTRSLDYAVQVIKTPEDIINNLYNAKKAKSELHGNKGDAVVDPKFLQTGILKLSNKEEPVYKVAVFLSASKNQAEENIEEIRKLGSYIADKGWGCQSGYGNTGLMGVLFSSVLEKNGWAEGSNCPHIVKFEGIPEGGDLYFGADDIHVRKAVIIARSESAVIAGWGGAGTLDEACSVLYLKTLHREKNKFLTREILEEAAVSSKLDAGKKIDLVFDNSKNLWTNVIQVFEIFGLKQGRNFDVANSTKEVTEYLDKYHERKINGKRTQIFTDVINNSLAGYTLAN
jgi:predicted Rossmann-fold nucleotide-binding protein